MSGNVVRSIVTLALIIIAGSTASAQSYLRGGIVAGINLGNAALEPDFPDVEGGTTRAMRLGPIVGGTLEWGVRDFPIAFQPEVQYIEKGVKVTYAQPAAGVDSTQDIRYSYIEFPVLARIPFMDGPTRVYAVVGPNFGFNFAARGLHESSRGASKADYFEDVARADIGIDVGVGGEIELSPGMYLLGDLRYTHGLTDVTVPVEDRGEETWYSRDFKIKAGIKWDLWQSRR
jgi:hypothetical protein